MNNKNSILLVDPDFDPSDASESILLIKVGGNSFSYAIIDSTTGQLKAVYDYQECLNVPATFSARLKNDSYLSVPFKQIKAAVYTENTLSIPAELFNSETLNDYAKFFPVEQGNNLYSQSVEGFPFKSVFTLDVEIEETINSALVNCVVFDHQAPLLALSKNTQASTLILDFTAGSFNAVYIKDGHLVFQRYFEIDNPEEFNYYLLYIINQLKISKGDTQVLLSGVIHEDDLNYNCIVKYFQSIKFKDPPAIDIENSILDDMPAHYYSSLLALNLCE